MKFIFKKICVLFFLILIGLNVSAQSADSSITENTNPVPFRHWSFGLNAGMITAYSPFNAQEDFKRSGLDFGYGGYVKYQFWPVLALQANILRGAVSGSEAFSGAYIDYKTSLKYAADISANLSFFSARFNQGKNFIRPYLTAGYGLASYQPTFTDIEGAVYVVDHNIKNVYVPVGLGFMVGLAKRVNFDFGYTLNLINGDNLDAYNYGMNKDQFSYVHVGLSLQIGNPKAPVKKVKPTKSIIREPVENKADTVSVKDSLVKATDSLKATEINKTKDNAAGIVYNKPDSDGDGVPDELDKCPNTPKGNAVNAYGCLIEGRKVQVKGYPVIYFDVNSSVLKTSSYSILEAIVADLKAAPSKSIEINGYASSEGNVAHNIILSKDRANAVKTFLMNAGINGKNLKTTGYGEARPIADNSTEKGRKKNRRVEVTNNQ